MLDLMDILEGRFEQTCPGTYYVKKPRAVLNYESAQDGVEGKPLDYEFIDPTSYHYRSILGNMTDTTSIICAIKTKDNYDYKIGGYIVLSDGRLCTINAVTQDTSKTAKQARRMFPIPLGTEFIIRLIEVDNPRGIV